ncbi:MAG: hypothetical protein ACPGVP_05100 [Thiolinea sp.]
MEWIALIGMTPFTLLHILGVAFGLGIATGMDFLLVRNVFRHAVLTETHVNSLTVLSKFVSIALIMLWISGIGFLLHYAVVTPEKLTNPKIWSKLSIVAILTLNGMVIHYAVLPKLRGCVGKSLLAALPYKILALFFVTGAVSFVSWYFPFFYGTLPVLNFAFSFYEFSAAYLAVLSVAVLAGLSILGYLYSGLMAAGQLQKPVRINNYALQSEKGVIPVSFGQQVQVR